VTRHALIIGGSRGIELALVRALLADPGFARVTAASRSAQRSDALAVLASEHGARLGRLEVDVSDEASIERATAALRIRSCICWSTPRACCMATESRPSAGSPT
jgi:NAD(P)-dependent dehydrogenase (short-subunit alcohol dehydrogenase family)